MAPRMTRRGFVAGVIGAVGAAAIGFPSAAAASGPRRMVEGHLYCDRCHAAHFPSGPRIDANHIAVRLDDRDERWAVTLDGERVEDRTIEAYAGLDGWVVMEAHAPEGWTGLRSYDRDGVSWPLCPDCYSFLFEVRRGNVGIISMAELERYERAVQSLVETMREIFAP